MTSLFWPPPVSATSAWSVVKKSPGGNWMMMKVMIDTATSVGIMTAMRLRI